MTRRLGYGLVLLVQSWFIRRVRVTVVARFKKQQWIISHNWIVYTTIYVTTNMSPHRRRYLLVVCVSTPDSTPALTLILIPWMRHGVTGYALRVTHLQYGGGHCQTPRAALSHPGCGLLTFYATQLCCLVRFRRHKYIKKRLSAFQRRAMVSTSIDCRD